LELLVAKLVLLCAPSIDIDNARICPYLINLTNASLSATIHPPSSSNKSNYTVLMFTLPFLAFYLVNELTSNNTTYAVGAAVVVVNCVIAAYVYMAFNSPDDDDDDEEEGDDQEGGDDDMVIENKIPVSKSGSSVKRRNQARVS
jgi:hypothetical protein